MILLQVIVDLTAWAIQHWREVTLFGAINFVAVALGKRIVMKQLQKLFGLSETQKYLINQQRIEKKLDYLIERSDGTCADTSKPMSAHSAPGSNEPFISQQAGTSLALYAAHRETSSSTNYSSRRQKRMKEFLRRIGRTKFLAFVTATLTNAVMLTGYFLNWQDVQSQVTEFVPAINVIAQIIATAVYILVEGKVDQVKLESGGAVNEEYPADHGPTV